MRRWLRRELDGHPALETAVLLADELAANAVRHTRGGYAVRARWDDVTISVNVADEGADFLPGLPCPRPHADEVWVGDPAESGRGLILVRALSTRWGVTETCHGCEVWFEVLAAGPAQPRRTTRLEAIPAAGGFLPTSWTA